MATAVIKFRISDPKDITSCYVFIDEVPLSQSGSEYRIVVEVGVPHTIRYNFTGQPGGSLKAEVIDHGNVVASRDAAKIPLGKTHSWDRLHFTIEGDN